MQNGLDVDIGFYLKSDWTNDAITFAYFSFASDARGN